MADRHRSHDKSRDSEKLYGDKDSAISHGGRKGGNLQRDIGTRDEEKRANERPAGVTRVTESDEQEDGNA